MKVSSSENKKMIKKSKLDVISRSFRDAIKKGEYMSRAKQRENRKKKIAEEKIEKRNSHGYLDLTAYEAVKNIVRQQNRGETGIDRQI